MIYDDVPANEDAELPGTRTFEDLTLAEVIELLVRSPRQTTRSLLEVIRTPAQYAPPPIAMPQQPEVRERTRMEHSPLSQADRRVAMQLGLRFSALVMAIWGCRILISTGLGGLRTESNQLADGLPFLLIGALIWLYAEVYGDWPVIQRWWERRRGEGEPVETDAATDPSRPQWVVIHPVRVFAAVGVLPSVLMAWEGTANNHFSLMGFWGWITSIVLVLVAVAPDRWRPDRLLVSFYRCVRSIRVNWTLLALLGIMVIAAYFRLYDLDGVPPEMTSDHKEKLEDAQRVVEGARDVFFTDNGGREGFQMYALALLAQLPGLQMNFTLLKILAVIESLATIPVLWWMGREVVNDRRYGNLVGLALAALVAVSYWHVTMTRLSLRIVLTPLVAALLLIYLARGMRDNRRGDFIMAGLVLGFGMYTYQAVRMLPLVVLAGVAFALIGRWRQWQRYLFNLTLLVVVSLVIFVPLARFSVDYPNLFWMRTAGRILGDDVIQDIDDDGTVTEREATFEERMDALQENLPILTDNLRNALLMFNWKGDVGWINGVPNQPAMDIFTGGLFIVGVIAWLALTVRRRDPVYALVPVMLLIMLLPSALSIAMPMENPSATRTSGALPAAYLMAALPLTLMVVEINRVLVGRSSQIVAGLLVGVVLVGAYSANSTLYFEDYVESYRESWRPHSEPGAVLRGFTQSDGSYANAFLIGYTHWLDHIIVGMEAGVLDWPNGIVGVENVPDFVIDRYYCETDYVLDVDRDLLFFYYPLDTDSETALKRLLPDGRVMDYDSDFDNGDFKMYRVPALGQDGFEDFVADHADDPVCLPD